MKGNQERKLKTTDEKYLKQLFPDIQQRKTYCERLIIGKKLKAPIIVRIEPSKKIQQKKLFTTLVVQRTTKLGQIRIFIQQKLNLNENNSIYLFNSKTTLPLIDEVGNLYNTNKEQDGILYIQYAEHDVFG